MIVAKLPWFAVQQYATVVTPDGPRSVLDPRRIPAAVALRNEQTGRISEITMVDPNELVTVLIPETQDALATLSAAGFTYEVIE